MRPALLFLHGDFRLARNTGQQGASEVQDLLAGVDWLLERGGVDPERMGLWGGSYGAYLTQFALGRHPDLRLRGAARAETAGSGQ